MNDWFDKYWQTNNKTTTIQKINVTEEHVQKCIDGLVAHCQMNDIDTLIPIMGSGMEIASRIAKQTKISNIIPLYGFSFRDKVDKKEDTQTNIDELQQVLSDFEIPVSKCMFVEDIVDSGKTIKTLVEMCDKVFILNRPQIISLFRREGLSLTKEIYTPQCGLYDETSNIYWVFPWERLNELP